LLFAAKLRKSIVNAKFFVYFCTVMQTGKTEIVPLLMPAISLIIGIITAPMMPNVGGLVTALAVCVLLAWGLRRWGHLQSIGILLCFFWMGMLVGQRVERTSKGYRRIEIRGGCDEKQSKMERVKSRFLDYRNELLNRYKTQSVDDEQYAVLVAMTLGDKSALTKELRETYSVTGASHILALSGLHLGIIYLLLFRLTLGRRRSWLSQVVIILSIWAFAFLTGLSTSVVRSATMISIYALFSVAGRHRSPVNILCFTAIVMLLVNPASLFDIGFQLSFSAVLAILLLMPLFESFFPENYFAGRPLQRYIYNMVGLSVAAQIGVAPLIAYYFGRFSTYFLLTNFIVIPAATIILYGALLVVLVPSLAPVLLGFVGILNKALGWISQMPCASIDGLHPSVLQICLLYVVFACIYFSLRTLQRVPPIT
jgi:competence protein ComEC